MGHKKRTKHPPPPSTVAAAAAPAPALAEQQQQQPQPQQSQESDSAAIKQECERALTALRRGNYTKALRLMKDSCAKHNGEALIHRVHGTVCVKVASIIDDNNGKQRHLRNAIDAGRRAAELAPNSVEFAHFYANLLYEAATEGKEYEEVMKECDRALEIENPIDPAKESLQEESQQKISTAEGRIAHVQGELRSLKQKSSIASISTWMKNLGTGDEIRLIPIRRVAEDPMEVRFVPTRRPNEIKKATKTPEERRQEIEVRVAAARLMQQQQRLETGLGVTEGERIDKGVEVTSGSDRRGERRKYGSNARKNESNTERKAWVRSYWNSMKLEMKRELLELKVSELKSYFGSSRDGLASEVLNEALGYAMENKGWRFWLCCRCNERFVDSDSHMQHVVQEHMGSLLPKMQEVLPQSIDNEWNEMILNWSWKPLDISSAIKMLENQGKFRNGELVEDFYDDDCDDCFKDAWDSSPEKEKLRNGSNDSTVGSSDTDKVYSIEGKEYDGNQLSIAYSIDSWPMSEDSERAKLLEKIQHVLQELVRHKYLAGSHLHKMIQFTVDGLQSHASGPQLLNLNHGVDQTPLCICLSGELQLKRILKFLQELSHSCGLGRHPEKSNVLEDINIGQGPEIKEKIVLNGDGSCLYLDDSLLPLECAPSPCPDDDVATATSAIVGYKDGVVTDVDALLSWMFSGQSSGEQLQSWMRTKEEKTHQGIEILETLEKEFYNLQGLCERKCEHLSYEQALQAVESRCLEEGKKREDDASSECRSYDSVLRQRREQLINIEHDALLISGRFELDAISNVLKEAETLNVNQFGYEDTYGRVTSQLCDLESGEDCNLRIKDQMHQLETSIEISIQRQKEQLSIELSKIDARIMHNVYGMQQLELKLDLVSTNDYRSILLPLVKSYMRAHLEDLAEKDATEKSDAAREAFLAELDLDSKKGTQGRSDNSRSTVEKVKDKRKNKDYKKTKDSKVAVGSDQHLLQDVTDERGSLPVVSDGDYLEPQILSSGTDDDLKQKQEEFRRKIEIEEEERMLEESLEYQRRIENEAKQKHLAGQQHKKSNPIFTENVSGEARDLCFDSGSDDLYEPLKSGLSDIVEGMPMTAATEPSAGATAEIGPSPSDRRSGRRGRRQKGSTRSSDGKYQQMSEKENIGVGDTPNVGDTAPKTLRQLQAENDDEERFQADLRKAVRQSLGASEDADVTDVFGTGLKNDIGEYNCFLNVIIQSLWHLRRFRDEFLSRSASEHVHVGDPCVVCALYDIFAALSIASTDTRRESVAPTSLRIALSKLYPNSSFFQEGEMNDASEVLGVIFDCLHRAFTSALHGSDFESMEHGAVGSWVCTKKNACIVHSLFGMDISEQMNCRRCGLESRHLKYAAFFHNINARALRTMKAACAESSFDELLNAVERSHQLTCDPETSGCGQLNYIHHFLSAPPQVFTTVLGWQHFRESVQDIKSTLAALSTEIDISVLYCGLEPKKKYSLVSVVCYYGQHYHCFAFSHQHDRWIMYDDNTVKVIGSWTDVLTMCEKGHLQPQLLFFESGN